MGDNNRFYDLDRFLEEAVPSDKPALPVRLFGKVYRLPASVEARLIVRAQRIRRIGSDLLDRAIRAEEAIKKGEDAPSFADLSEDEVEMYRTALQFSFRDELVKIVGTDIANEWIDKLNDYRRLQVLYWEIIRIYESGRGPETEDEAPNLGEAKARKDSKQKTS